MAITCRLPSVERLFGQRLSEIDESSLERLILAGHGETLQLDFKSTWTVTGDPDELRKDVCALLTLGEDCPSTGFSMTSRSQLS